MAAPMSDPDPDPNSSPEAEYPSPEEPSAGSQPSTPSEAHYLPELPYPNELQAWLEGRYIVESFLGQGGMGAVYAGLQMPLRRPVAIKILRKQNGQDEFDFDER